MMQQAIDPDIRLAFQKAIDEGFLLDWMPLWVRALSSTRLLLAAHRRGVPTEVFWQHVVRDAVAMWDYEQRGHDICGGSDCYSDPQRGPLWMTFVNLANMHDANYVRGLEDYVLEHFRADARRRVLDAAEAFPWGELPEAKMVVSVLRLCGKWIGV